MWVTLARREGKIQLFISHKPSVVKENGGDVGTGSGVRAIGVSGLVVAQVSGGAFHCQQCNSSKQPIFVGCFWEGACAISHGRAQHLRMQTRSRYRWTDRQQEMHAQTQKKRRKLGHKTSYAGEW